MSTNRKDEHVALALVQRGADAGESRNDFDDIEFIHHALAGIDPATVDLSVEVAGARWAVPFYINGMTGGTAKTGVINRALAAAAHRVGVPMASGSMSVALRHPEVMDTFRCIREENPDGFVMANLGADHTPDEALRVVEVLQADALEIHLNAVQETVMPEGSRDFSSWPQAIAAICEAVAVPVIVKEVGFGLSRRTLEELAELGVTVADLAGRGGTNFARIENERRRLGDYSYLLGWGQSAVCCLLDSAGTVPTVLASGGVRNPLDVLRALALGARAVGVAGTFLQVAVERGADGLAEELERWKAHVTQLMAMLGARTPADLTRTDVLVRGSVREFCELRGIDAARYARRG